MEFDYQFPIPEDGKLFDEKKRVQVGNASGVIEMVDPDACHTPRIIHNLEWRTGMSVAIDGTMTQIVEHSSLAFCSVNDISADIDRESKTPGCIIVHLRQKIPASEYVNTHLE